MGKTIFGLLVTSIGVALALVKLDVLDASSLRLIVPAAVVAAGAGLLFRPR